MIDFRPLLLRRIKRWGPALRIRFPPPGSLFSPVPSMAAGAKAPLAPGQVQDYGFLFLVVDPGGLLPGNPFAAEMSRLVKAIQATPRRPGS